MKAPGAATSSSHDDNDDEPVATSSDAVDESEDGATKPGRHAKAATKRREEKRVMEREELLSSGDGVRPTTAADYDRLLITSPNSSVVWVNYIAHHVALGEIDRARKVAERALKTISVREDKEKWNVWVALLSLENLYGSKESLADAFKRCLQHNDGKRSYMELAKVYAGANRHSDAVTAYTDACNKFHSDADVWISYAIYLSRQNNYDEVRSLLKRAVEKLPKKEHARVISKFATLEFKHGSAERVDIWSVYLDQELRPEATGVASNHVIIRRLFERVTSMNLSSKKSRFFFKRWLAFEKQYGNDAQRDHVLARARAFVEGGNGNTGATNDDDDA
jgi:rRNA biogenesis protein RRP5